MARLEIETSLAEDSDRLVDEIDCDADQCSTHKETERVPSKAEDRLCKDKRCGFDRGPDHAAWYFLAERTCVPTLRDPLSLVFDPGVQVVAAHSDDPAYDLPRPMTAEVEEEKSNAAGERRELRTRRIVNVPLVTASLIMAAVVVALIHSFRYYEVKQVARHVLMEADRWEDAGQLRKSASYLQTYVSLHPNDRQALDRLARLGMTLESNAVTRTQVCEVAFIYSHVLRCAPERQDVRLRCVGLTKRFGLQRDEVPMFPAKDGGYTERVHMVPERPSLIVWTLTGALLLFGSWQLFRS